MNDEERYKKIKDRQDQFLADIAEDMLDEETIRGTESTIKTVFKKASIPYTRASLKAFSEGQQIIMAAQHSGGDQVVMGLISATRKIISDLEAKVKSATNDHPIEK